jgi:hypothetical protein
MCGTAGDRHVTDVVSLMSVAMRAPRQEIHVQSFLAMLIRDTAADAFVRANARLA